MAKKQIKYSVVDAFTDKAFKGNPAAVCLLEEERDEEWMQLVASEFNLSATSFLTRITESEAHSDSPNSTLIPRFGLRWFSPVVEVKLCGHATLAAAHSLFTSGLVDSNTIEFSTLSGILTAKRVSEEKKLDTFKYENGEAKDSFFIELDFPVVPSTEFKPAEVPRISKALSDAPIMDMVKTIFEDLIIVLPSGKMVADLEPQFEEIQKCAVRGIIVTGVAPPESGFDLYSRFFCPKLGVMEDPVCGSAHCALAPYWSKMLGKSDFVAYQASRRGGILNLHVDEQNKRVMLEGKAVTVMEGSILV